MGYPKVQTVAKDTMAYARQNIKPGMRLTEVRRLCEAKMRFGRGFLLVLEHRRAGVLGG